MSIPLSISTEPFPQFSQESPLVIETAEDKLITPVWSDEIDIFSFPEISSFLEIIDLIDEETLVILDIHQSFKIDSMTNVTDFWNF